MYLAIMAFLLRIPILGIIPRIFMANVILSRTSVQPPDRILGCDLQAHYQHATFSCPQGWTQSQTPTPPQFASQSVTSRQTNAAGEQTSITVLSIARYWKHVINVPTVCNNTGSIAASTAVEQATQFSANLQSEIGSAGVTVSLKTTNTLGFTINIGKTGFETNNGLFQQWVYVHWHRRYAGLGAAIAWYFWGGGYDCEQANEPENNFAVHVCERKCSTSSTATSGTSTGETTPSEPASDPKPGN